MPADEVLAVLDAAGRGATESLIAIEQRLEAITGAAHGPIGEFATAAVGGGGKRLRPLLAVLSAGPSPVDPAAVVRAGTAVELVHAATLVHDDILDGAATRRGNPTVSASGGREMAVAVGDWLFAAAFGELVHSGASEVELLAQAGSDLARGELLQRADSWKVDITRDRYLERCRLKTARLFQAAASLGSRAGGHAPQPAEEFANAVGVAFQLLDDVLDVSGPMERTGKPRGTDLLDGTVTLPLIIARERDSRLAEISLRDVTSDNADDFCDQIEATGALDAVRETADEWIETANLAIERMDGVSPQAFRLVARALVDRVS